MRASDRNAEIMGFDLGRLHRMVDPFVLVAIERKLTAECPRLLLLLGALVDDRALVV